jgi:hypothetical protein
VTVPDGVDPGAYERLTDDGFEIFDATAAGILAWVETTRPRPPRDAVVSHVLDLRRRGILPAADLAALRVAYPELGS